MYQSNGYSVHDEGRKRPTLPTGAIPPRIRTNSSQSDEPTPVATQAPVLPLQTSSVTDDLYASIERDLKGFGGIRKRASDPKLLETSGGSFHANGIDSSTSASIVSMYARNGSPSESFEHPYIPPARSSSTNVSPVTASPSSPSTSAHRITASNYSPTHGSIRRSAARPLPPTPQAPRVPSSNTRPPLASLTEGAQVDAWQPQAGPSRLVYTPPTAGGPAAFPGSPSSVGRLSVDSAHTTSSSLFSPHSPNPDPFDPVTGKVTRKTSYDLGSASMAYSTPSTSSSILRLRTESTSTLPTRASGTKANKGVAQKEEPVPLHLNAALLSHLAMFVKDRVPRAQHTRGAVPYLHSFTGQDVVVRALSACSACKYFISAQNTVQRALPEPHKADRRVGLQIARSLHGQLLFFDMRDNTGALQDNLDGVYTFLDEEGIMPDLGEGSSSQRISAIPVDELPTAVQTTLTSCYSPFCNRMSALGQSGGCYSPSCPNSGAASTTSEQSGAPSASTASDVPWVATVPPELLSLLGDTEIKRQNEIHELINGESDYVRDIDVLRTEFLEPIADAEPPIIASDEQSTFFAEVLLNAFEIREHAAAFSEALQHRQREQGPVIQSIGDVVLAAASDWAGAYLHYATDYPFAEARLKREQAANPAFDAFLNSFTRRTATRKLSMLHYQTRITVRLQRYILLLDGIRKHTPEENADRLAIEQAIALLTAQCKAADEGVAASTLRLACRNYERDLVDRPGSSYIKDLDLSSDERLIVQRGRMLRKPESSSLSDWTELFVILLDNYLIMTKPRAQGRNGETRYHISRRPVPLELLTIFDYEDGPVPRSSGFHLPRSNTESSVYSTRDDRMLWPITFQYSGRQGGIATLFAESSRSRDEWREKLQSAIANRQKVLESSKVMEVVPMCQDAFFMRQNAHEAPVLRDGIRSVGKPTCSVAFQTPEGHQLVAIGHDDGLWIGLRHDPTSFRLVLHLKLITQCAVLQEFALVLVLADKALYAYPLEALVPSAASSAIQREKEPQKISGTKDVAFFRAGKVGPRLLVLYVKKQGVNQTVFKALEPIAPNDRSKATLLKRRPDWFRTYKDFFLPSETFAVNFLRTQLSIVCAKGFELLSLEAEPLKMTSFPDWNLIARNDARAAEMAKRCVESKAIVMFRLDESEFLFVYEDLAIYSDRHGDPIPSRFDDIIDWHGRPRHVVFIRPFLVAFDSSFIEIRHAHTGKLVQIIKSRDVYCTFDGLGGAGNGTGESERRPHLTLSQNGRHLVAELAPIDSRGA